MRTDKSELPDDCLEALLDQAASSAISHPPFVQCVEVSGMNAGVLWGGLIRC